MQNPIQGRIGILHYKPDPEGLTITASVLNYEACNRSYYRRISVGSIMKNVLFLEVGLLCGMMTLECGHDAQR